MEPAMQLLDDMSKDIDRLRDKLECLKNLKLEGDICDDYKTLTDRQKSIFLEMHHVQHSFKIYINQCQIPRNTEKPEKAKNKTDHEEKPKSASAKDPTMQDFCNEDTFDIDSLTQRLKIVQQSKKTTTKVESQCAAIPKPIISINYAKYLQKKQQKYVSND